VNGPMSPRPESGLKGMDPTTPGPRVHLRSEESGGEVTHVRPPIDPAAAGR
jgi:hypothetical protein